MFRSVNLPPNSQSICLDPAEFRWTPFYEVKFLCWLAQQFPGNILEIGCNTGNTTRALALTNPDKLVFGVDYLAADDSMVRDQKYEKPKPDELGILARDLPNVRCLNLKSEQLQYSAASGNGDPARTVYGVRFVFIDGDHSYAGVKQDTEKALAHLRQVQGCLVWHDCADDRGEWVGVKSYLESEFALRYPVLHVQDTLVAYSIIGGPWLAVQRWCRYTRARLRRRWEHQARRSR